MYINSKINKLWCTVLRQWNTTEEWKTTDASNDMAVSNFFNKMKNLYYNEFILYDFIHIISNTRKTNLW